MTTSVFSATPAVTVCDNRRLSVRTVAFCRHPDTPAVTETLVSFLTRDPLSAADPRLH